MADLTLPRVECMKDAKALIQQIEAEFQDLRNLHDKDSKNPNCTDVERAVSRGSGNAYDLAAQRMRDIIFQLDTAMQFGVS